MRATRLALASFLLVGLALSCATRTETVTFAQGDPPADEPLGGDPNGWPRVFEAEGLKFTVYEPQLEKWDGMRLLARSAVAVEKAASPVQTYGTVWFVARTHVDKEQRIATLDGFSIPRASFPSAPDQQEAWIAILRARFPDHVKTIDLDRLQQGLAQAEATEKAQAIPVKNDAPRIIFSSRPALLVIVDGKPVLRRLEGTRLLRVVNTRALLLQDDASGRYVLGIGNRWAEAPSLDGPWAPATTPPEGVDGARRMLVTEKAVDLHETDKEIVALLDRGALPDIFASTQPAELIETVGEPELVAIEGTDLRWVRNTDASVFFTSSNEWFVLVSGRWYRAPSRDGPWRFVPGRELPPSFAKIPPTHPAGEVLASIPGTPQAREALIANEVPQTAAVDRRGAQLSVTYDGEPRFEPIEGTHMRWARNCQTPIIQVGDLFYACDDGIWFVGSSPSGPWTVADSVPAEVYSIPTSCPIHYVTYVRVYDATPDYVYVGYTPGYFGTCVYDGCVVWGTGFWYAPWCGRYWYGYPWTFGFGVGVRWSSAWGWNVGIGVGCRAPCRPWWGPLGRPHPAFFPVGVGFHWNLGNANIYRAWPSGAVRTFGGEGFGRGGFRAGARNDVFSDREGRVFRHGDGGWERHENGAWQRSGAGERGLESDRAARDRSFERSREMGRERAPEEFHGLSPQHGETQPARPNPEPFPRGLHGGGTRRGGGGHGGHR